MIEREGVCVMEGKGCMCDIGRGSLCYGWKGLFV